MADAIIDTAPAALTIAEWQARVGSEIGVSDWMQIDQARIDAFAELTGDRQFIHVDPVAAKAKTPFGGTIAHGFLTLSLLPPLAAQAVPAVAGRAMGINYGFNRLRFLAPVKAGSRVRGRFRLAAVEARAETQYLLRYEVTVEIEGEATPALAADWLTLAVMA
jgi:acyl dehydratase